MQNIYELFFSDNLDSQPSCMQVPLIIMLLIKLENLLILFRFFLLEAQSFTFSYIKNYAHRPTAIHIFGMRGFRSWKTDNTGIFLETIIIPTRVHKLVEQVLFL